MPEMRRDSINFLTVCPESIAYEGFVMPNQLGTPIALR